LVVKKNSFLAKKPRKEEINKVDENKCTFRELLSQLQISYWISLQTLIRSSKKLHIQ